MAKILKRVGMVNAIFLGGMSFNNAGLGYVHSMAHQLGAVYNCHMVSAVPCFSQL